MVIIIINMCEPNQWCKRQSTTVQNKTPDSPLTGFVELKLIQLLRRPCPLLHPTMGGGASGPTSSIIASSFQPKGLLGPRNALVPLLPPQSEFPTFFIVFYLKPLESSHDQVHRTILWIGTHGSNLIPLIHLLPPCFSFSLLLFVITYPL